MITTEEVEKMNTNAPSQSVESGNDVLAEKNKKKKLIKYAVIGLVGAVALYFVYTKVIVKKKPTNIVKAEL